MAGIALRDLLQEIRAQLAGIGRLAQDGGVREPGDGGIDDDGGWTASDAELARCYTIPATYEIWVELDSARNRWKVLLLDTAECAQDVYGGSAEYEIDASSFEILRRELFE